MTTLTPNSALAKAEMALPLFDWNNENKRKYLSYRLCGFNREEAAKYAEVNIKTVNNWKNKDQAFADIETRNLLELRREVAKEVVALDYTRNFKLALAMDEKLLRKATDQASLMTKDDQALLKVIRPLYSPQGLAVIEAFFEEDKGAESFDELILIARKRRVINAEPTQPGTHSDEEERFEAQYPKGAIVESGS